MEPKARDWSGRDADGPIVLEGVSTHNLRGIDVHIPFRKFTVLCGPSGSGKSSLAFDTLFAASRQRYVESFSAYVRALIDKGGRADFAAAHGLTPPIAVARSSSTPSPRSTVGTMTEIHDYYRLLYSRAGTHPPELGGRPLTASMFSFNHEQGACPGCGGLGTVTVTDPERLITDAARSLLAGAMNGTKTGRFYGDPHGQFVAALMAAGEAAGWILQALPGPHRGRTKHRPLRHGRPRLRHRLVLQAGNRAGDFRFRGPWKGFAILVAEEYVRKHADHRGEAMRVLMRDDPCPDCGGRRLKPESLAVTYRGLNIAGLSALTVTQSLGFFANADAPAMDARTAAVTAAVGGGDLAAARPHPRRRPRLSPSRPRIGDSVGRGSPATAAGRTPRRQAHRRHVRPG